MTDRRFKGFIFDLDGTIYLSERLIPGADVTVKLIRASGGKAVFISNKAIQRAGVYSEKLNRLGIPVEPADVLNSSKAAAMALAKKAPSARLYVIGERSLVDELSEAGFEITDDPKRVDYVVLSFDRTFHYGKLNIAMQAVRNGARLCATNPDRTCPFDGYELPDAAGVIGAVEGVTGAKVEFVAGKPSPLMIDAALERMGLEAGECLMIGDRLETDIRMGRESGTGSALVMTGVTTREMLATSDDKPDFVLDSVADIPDKFL